MQDARKIKGSLYYRTHVVTDVTVDEFMDEHRVVVIAARRGGDSVLFNPVLLNAVIAGCRESYNTLDVTTREMWMAGSAQIQVGYDARCAVKELVGLEFGAYTMSVFDINREMDYGSQQYSN